MLSFDGGAPGTVGAPLLDGGSPGSVGAVVDGGVPSTVVADVPDGTDRVTLWRSCEGRALKVRGGVDRAYSGTLALLDMEAGFDTDSVYELECWSGEESLGRVSLGSVVLPWEGGDGAVLVQQPLEPSLNATVVNLDGSWPQVTRGARSDVVFPEGARYPTLISGGPRQGIAGAAVDFGVTSRSDADRLWRTLGSEERPQLQVWLVRSRGGLLPRVFFARVGDLTEVDIDTRLDGEWSRFQAELDEVRPPAPALVAALLTYADFAAVFPSYSGMGDEFPTYSGMGSAWEYAGAAGG